MTAERPASQQHHPTVTNIEALTNRMIRITLNAPTFRGLRRAPPKTSSCSSPTTQADH